MLIETDAKKRFPKYESDMIDKNELTPDELVEQSHKFMKKFGATFGNPDFPNVIFFLDKSARPLSYTFRKLFPEYYSEQKIPQIRFINIQKSPKWDDFNNDPQIVRTIYKPWLKNPKKICVVDEYSATGNTLKFGMTLLQDIFPEAEIIGKSAYEKCPSWHMIQGHTGVRDLDWDDYQKIAIKNLGEDSEDLDKQNIEMERIKNTIPYVARSNRRLYFREYREEQDLICQEILKFKQEEEKIS